MYALFSFVVLIAMVAALIDIILRDSWQVKHLPKLGWVLLVIFLPLIGSVLWFSIGREWPQHAQQPRTADPRHWGTSPEHFRAAHTHDARSTEQQLADLDREIEMWNRRSENGTGTGTEGSAT